MGDRNSASGGMQVIVCVFASLVMATTSMAQSDHANRKTTDRELAQTILQDERMDAVVRMGHELLKSGMNAGSSYSEVWIRDLNTFIVPLLDVAPRQSVREALLVFFHFQGEDGNIVDGYVPKQKGHVGYKYRFTATKPDLKAHKNTVETDQESSLVQAVCRYIRKTKDSAILDEVVRDIPVRKRLEMALEYPLKHYQNGGDWTWFGARMVRQLARNGYVEQSYRELVPMLERALKHRGFFEWWTPSNQPKGSGKFRGSAGVLIEAIHELREWANSQPEK